MSYLGMIYFGHSRMFYGTEEEKIALEIIRKIFQNYKILNPNKKKHQRGCLDDYSGVPGTEMRYFVNLTKLCSLGVFLVYDKDKWSPGSYTEASFMLENGKPVYLIDLENRKVDRIYEIKNYYTFEEEKEKLINEGKELLAGENG